jgi:hypothetical protein
LAMIEGPYLMAEIVRHFNLDLLNGPDIMPIGRLTIRPNISIRCQASSVVEQ